MQQIEMETEILRGARLHENKPMTKKLQHKKNLNEKVETVANGTENKICGGVPGAVPGVAMGLANFNGRHEGTTSAQPQSETSTQYQGDKVCHKERVQALA